jgi:iron complex outermembrane recepter protein
VKQKYWRIVFSLLTVLSFNEVRSQADAAEKPTTVAPATTVRQWRSQSIPTITEIRTRKTPRGIEIRVITSDNRMLQGIKSVRGNNLIIDFPNTRLNPRLSEEILDSTEGISALQITTLRNQTVRIIVSGNAGTLTGEVLKSDRGAIIRVISPPVAEIPTIDLIVTAEKKPERLQDVPISITLLTKEQQKMEILRLLEILPRIPLILLPIPPVAILLTIVFEDLVTLILSLAIR